MTSIWGKNQRRQITLQGKVSFSEQGTGPGGTVGAANTKKKTKNKKTLQKQTKKQKTLKKRKKEK